MTSYSREFYRNNYDIFKEDHFGVPEITLFKARKLIMDSKYDQVKSILSSLETQPLSKTDILHSEIIRSELNIRLGDFDGARQILTKIDLEYLSTTEESHLYAYFLSTKGYLLRQVENYAEALGMYQQALEIWQQLEYNEKIADTLTELGVVYRQLNKYDQAEKYYLESISYRNEMTSKRSIGATYHNLGSLKSQQGLYAEALQYAKKSYELFKAVDHTHFQAIALNLIAICNWRIGNFAKARHSIMNSIKLKENFDNKFDLLIGYSNLGNILYDMNEMKEALDIFITVLDLASALALKEQIARCHNNLGRVYLGLGKNQQAIGEFLKSYEMYESIGNEVAVITPLINLGQVSLLIGDTKEAERFLNQAYFAANQISNNHLKSYALIGQSRLYWMLDHIDAALDSINKAIFYLEEIGNKSDLVTAYGLLFDISMAIEDETKLCIILDKITDNKKYLHPNDLRIDLYQIKYDTTYNFKECFQHNINCLNTIISDDDNQVEYRTSAIYLLIQNIIKSFNYQFSIELYSRIKTLFEKLYEILNTNFYYPLLIETFILQAKFEMVNLELNRAQYLFDQARNIAVDKELPKFISLLETEQVELQRLFDSIVGSENIHEQRHLYVASEIYPYLSKVISRIDRTDRRLN